MPKGQQRLDYWRCRGLEVVDIEVPHHATKVIHGGGHSEYKKKMGLYFYLLLVLLSVSQLSHALETITSKAEFDQLLSDERVVVIEFMSSMCGSCKEFAPTFEKLAKAVKSAILAKIDIDIPEGMAIARSTGALEQGIPAVAVFASRNKPEFVMGGELKSKRELMAELRRKIGVLSRRDDGFYIKK